MVAIKKIQEAKVSQSVVGRTNATKQSGLLGMLHNPYVFMTCCFASLGCMMYGYDQGVMGSILVMENFQAHFPSLTGADLQGWLVASLELGAWAGALFNGYLADRISRKYSMLVAVIIFTLGTGLQVGAQNPGYLFAGRTIGGWGIGMFSMVIPLYQAEIAPPELRGSLVSLQQLSITIGTCISFWLDYGFHFIGGTDCDATLAPNGGYDSTGTFDGALAHGYTCMGEKAVSWRVPLALQLIPAWILFFGMFFLPFSPRWLMMKHRDEDCIASLSRLRRLPADDPLLHAEYLEIKAAVIFDEETEAELNAASKFGAWKALFVPNMFKRLGIGCWIMIFQQFTGINAVLYYAPQIFGTFGFSSVTTELLATGVTGCLQIVSTLPAVLFLDKFGRKTFLMVGAAGMFVCHVIVASIDGVYEDSDFAGARAAGWASIVFIWLFAVNFAYSWGPVAWVLTQELFPNSMRSRGVAIVASTNWMFNFVIGLSTRHMIDNMKFGTYIFFAFFCGAGGLFVWLLVPETKNKTLEELDIYFGGDDTTLAQQDRERMRRIEASLGLTALESESVLPTEKEISLHHDSA